MVNQSNAFDVPLGVLNKLKTKTFSRKIDGEAIRDDDQQSQIRNFVTKAFEEDVLEDTGPWKAIVLRVEVNPVPRVKTESFQHHLSPAGKSHVRGQSPMLVHLKCRIPELDMHLPIPRTGNTDDPKYPDHHIIDLYPTYTAMSDSTIMAKVKVGDIVIVDYADRKNFAEPIYVSPIAAQKNQMVINITAGGFGPACAPAGIGNQGARLGGAQGVAPHQGNLSQRFRARNSNAKAVIFGDSQIAGTLGNFLQKYVESLGYTVVGTSMNTSADKLRTYPAKRPRVCRSGSGVHNWLTKKPGNPPGALGAYWQYLENALKTAKPDLVVCCMGGNDSGVLRRADKYLDLANKIRSVAPSCKFLWFGPPPATLKKDGSDSRIKLRKSRSAFANKLKNVLSGISGLTYIIPQDYMPNYFKGKNGDGIHVTAAGARELINALKTQGKTGPIRGNLAQKKVAPPRSPDKNKQLAQASISDKGKQWKSPELLLAAKQIVGSQMGSFTDRGSAETWLKEKASLLSAHLGMTKKDAFEHIKNRDFISGYAAAVKPGIKSLTWQPLRIKEWETIANQKHGIPGKFKITGTSVGSQYGAEILQLSAAQTGTGKKQLEAQSSAGNVAKLHTTMNIIRQLSYKFTAAQLVNINEEPLQGPLALPAVPKCQPVGSNASSPPEVPGRKFKSGGRYSIQEAAALARRVNKCLKSKNREQVPIDAMVAFIGVESGYKKPSKNLVRFEPHVWYATKNIAPKGQPVKYKRTKMLNSNIPYQPGRSKCKSKMIGSPFKEGWFRSFRGSNCAGTTRVDYISSSHRNAFDRAAKIDLPRAVRSSSWGSFQIMGFNVKKIIRDMFNNDYKKFLNAFDNNQEELSIKMICHFLARRPKLISHIKNKNWKRVAKIYNGSERYAKSFVKHLAKANKNGVGVA